MYWLRVRQKLLLFTFAYKGKTKQNMSQPELPGPLESFLNPISNFEGCFSSRFSWAYHSVNHKSPPLSKQACVFLPLLSIAPELSAILAEFILPLWCHLIVWSGSALQWPRCTFCHGTHVSIAAHHLPEPRLKKQQQALKLYPEKQPLVWALFTLWPW